MTYIHNSETEVIVQHHQNLFIILPEYECGRTAGPEAYSDDRYENMAVIITVMGTASLRVISMCLISITKKVVHILHLFHSDLNVPALVSVVY